eukprot:UN04083
MPIFSSSVQPQQQDIERFNGAIDLINKAFQQQQEQLTLTADNFTLLTYSFLDANNAASGKNEHTYKVKINSDNSVYNVRLVGDDSVKITKQ